MLLRRRKTPPDLAVWRLAVNEDLHRWLLARDSVDGKSRVSGDDTAARREGHAEISGGGWGARKGGRRTRVEAVLSRCCPPKKARPDVQPARQRLDSGRV